jgi:Nucleotidyltransferase domain.
MPQTDYAEKYRLPDRARWRVCVDEPYMNCEKTHPLQQRKIRALISEMKNDPDVRQIIVFGSSVTDRCHVGSDVDIYAVTSTDKMPVKGSYDFEYDLWTNFTADKRLKEEIMRKGVCVYVRGA